MFHCHLKTNQPALKLLPFVLQRCCSSAVPNFSLGNGTLGVSKTTTINAFSLADGDEIILTLLHTVGHALSFAPKTKQLLESALQHRTAQVRRDVKDHLVQSFREKQA